MFWLILERDLIVNLGCVCGVFRELEGGIESDSRAGGVWYL